MVPHMGNRVLGAALLLVLALAPFGLSRYGIDLLTQIMIFALLALSLNILIGYLGNISFGHAAFFAIGGYACAILQTDAGLPVALSLLAAMAISGAGALIIGYFCVKLNEIYFAMLTLAFSMLVWSIAKKWRGLTGGDDGYVGVTVPDWLGDPTSFYWFTLVIFAAAVAVVHVVCHSTFGRAMIAIRENETRAEFLGINVRRVRLIGFVIAGIVAGLAGAILALYNRGMFPESAYWAQSGQVLIMVLLGGMHFFTGPIIGAAALYLLEVNIGQYTQNWKLVLGIILLGIVMMAPEGIMGAVDRLRKRLGSRKGGGDA